MGFKTQDYRRKPLILNKNNWRGHTTLEKSSKTKPENNNTNQTYTNKIHCIKTITQFPYIKNEINLQSQNLILNQFSTICLIFVGIESDFKKSDFNSVAWLQISGWSDRSGFGSSQEIEGRTNSACASLATEVMRIGSTALVERRDSQSLYFATHIQTGFPV